MTRFEARMRYIEAAEGGRTRREIQETLGNKRAPTIMVLNRMIKDGLIRRKKITPEPRNPNEPRYLYEPTGKLP